MVTTHHALHKHLLVANPGPEQLNCGQMVIITCEFVAMYTVKNGVLHYTPGALHHTGY